MTTLTLTLKDDMNEEIRTYEKNYEEDINLYDAAHFFLNSLEVLGYTYVTDVAIYKSNGDVVKSDGW